MKVSFFRLSSDREEKLSEIFAFYGVKGENFSDQMREFIGEFHKKLFLYRNSLQPSDQQSERKPDLNEIF